jgi:mannose-6-phosphate isomerase-like protein (cupin superfamily)
MTMTSELANAMVGAAAPQVYSLRTQHVSAGYTRNLLAQTDLMHFHIMSYGPASGENALHAHMDEDHSFVVLEGEATFRGSDATPIVVKKHHMIFLPKDTYYAFSNSTQGPLVMLRVGASKTPPERRGRLDEKGKPIPGRQQPAGGAVLVEGQFFE